MRAKHLMVIAAVGAATACGRETREASNAYRWSGILRPGDTLHVWSSRGDVTVERAADSIASVAASARWSKGAPDEVVYARTLDDGGAYVCAFWGDGGRCDARGYDVRRGLWRRLFRKDSDMTVAFTARVPDGVVVDVRTTRGAIRVEATAPVRARTVDGDITVRTTVGPVRARTTDGDISVTMDSVAGTDSVYLATTNGDVTLAAGPALAGRVELHSSNGTNASDWPMVLSEVRRRDLKFTIGDDTTRVIRLRTTDGDVRLQRLRGPPPPAAAPPGSMAARPPADASPR